MTCRGVSRRTGKEAGRGKGRSVRARTPHRQSVAWRGHHALVLGKHLRSGDGLRASAHRTTCPLILPLRASLTVGFTVMSTHFRVTYATLSADNEELHAAYSGGLRLAKSWLGSVVSPMVSGKPRTGGPLFTVTSPGDVSLALCQVHEATAADVADAVAAAGAAAPRWARTPWAERRHRAPRRRRPDQRAVQRARRADEPGGRQEPARGARRRRGGRRPHPLLLPAGRGPRRLRRADGLAAPTPNGTSACCARSGYGR